MITKKYIGGNAYEILGIDRDLFTTIYGLADNTKKFVLEDDKFCQAVVIELTAKLGLECVSVDYSETAGYFTPDSAPWIWHSDHASNNDSKLLLYFVDQELNEITGDRICFRDKEDPIASEVRFTIRNCCCILQGDVSDRYQHMREPALVPVNKRLLCSINTLGFKTFIETIQDHDKLTF